MERHYSTISLITTVASKATNPYFENIQSMVLPGKRNPPGEDECCNKAMEKVSVLGAIACRKFPSKRRLRVGAVFTHIIELHVTIQ